LLLVALSGAPARADVALGDFDFDSALFGDALIESDGGLFSSVNWLNAVNEAPGNPRVLTGPDFETGIANIGLNGGLSYTVVYAQPILNGPGDDLGVVVARFSTNDFLIAVSQEGTTFTTDLLIAGSAAVLTSVTKAYFYGNSPFPGPLSAVLAVHPVDLDAFGLAPGDTIRAIRITGFNELDLVRVAGLARASGLPGVWPLLPDNRAQLGQAFAQYNWGSPGKYHAGLDIAASDDTPVYATADGQVTFVQGNDVGCGGGPGLGCADHGYGNTVIVQHSRPEGVRYTHYSHLAAVAQALLDACGPPDPNHRRVCPSGVHVTGGATALGTVGNTCYGLSQCPGSSAHLHLELKTFPTLGTLGHDDGEFGYTRRRPTDAGYEDPILHLHQTLNLPVTRVRVTAQGTGVALRLGPAGYRTLRALGSGEEFLAIRTAPATDNPACAQGWYQSQRVDGLFFADPSRPGSSLPVAWVCRGSDTEDWVEPTTSRLSTVSTGPGPGGGPHVRPFGLHDSTAAVGSIAQRDPVDQVIPPPGFFAYSPLFTGGVFVAMGDLDGDGRAELLTGPGAGGGPHVRAFRPDGTETGISFLAYPAAFAGGVRVATCDVNGDGRADLVLAPGAGGGPHVRVLDGATLVELAGFLAYSPAFAGGVFVACGDVDGDGLGDIITGPGPGGGPHVRVFALDRESPGLVTPFAELFAYHPAFAGGVRVATANLDGGDRHSVVTAPGPGGGPHVQALRWTGAHFQVLASFLAYPPAFAGGVFVAAADVTGDPRAEIITGADAGGGPHVRVFSGPGASTGISFFAYDAAFAGGVTVAGAP
jgi:murein DD-endopeptidase MepM/ murein hydrolase activator NlpD